MVGSSNGFSLAKKYGRTIILTSHPFHRPPKELPHHLWQMNPPPEKPQPPFPFSSFPLRPTPFELMESYSALTPYQKTLAKNSPAGTHLRTRAILSDIRPTKFQKDFDHHILFRSDLDDRSRFAQFSIFLKIDDFPILKTMPKDAVCDIAITVDSISDSALDCRLWFIEYSPL